MKKRVVFSLFCLAFASLGFVGCNNNAKMSANFDDNEYVISIDEEISFYDSIKVRGVKKDNIYFVSSNEDVLTATENGFKAKTSGQSYLLAKYKTTTLASVKVVVRYQFASPKNFTVNQENGALSWDNSYVVIEGQREYASNYEIVYSQINNGERGEAQTAEVNGNTFIFDEIGSYAVTVKAISDSNYIEDSSYSEEYVANYNAMGPVRNLLVNYENGFDTYATLTWDEKENAIYDLYINDLKVGSDVDNNSFTYDFSYFGANTQIKLEIVAKDARFDKMDTSTIFYLTKLTTPDVDYTYNENSGDGYLAWDSYAPFGYTVYFRGPNSSIIRTKVGESNFEILKDSNAISGSNSVSVIANGGNSGNQVYLSSNPAFCNVTKLPKPDVTEVQFDGSMAKPIFRQNGAKYAVKFAGDRIVRIDTSDEYNAIDLSTLDPGQYSFTITTLPTDGSSRSINSDDYTFNFTVLDNLGTIQHSLEEDENHNQISVLRFKAIGYATEKENYRVVVNGTTIDPDNFTTEIDEEDARYRLIKLDLHEINPEQLFIDDGDNSEYYQIQVFAQIKEGDTIISTEVCSEKLLTILDPSFIDPDQIEAISSQHEYGEFYWENDQDAGNYQYYIYRSDALLEDKTLITTSEIVADKEIEEELEYGYYTIKVVTKTKDINEYLDSNFFSAENILVADLIVKKQVEKPEVEFVYSGNTYKLLITPVSFADTYSVCVGDNQDNGQFEETNPIEYTFINNFANAGEYEISVIAKCADATLHPDSDARELTIKRLPNPGFDIAENFDSQTGLKTQEKLTVTGIDEDAKGVQIFANGDLISQDSAINLFDYSTTRNNTFTLKFVSVAKDPAGDNYFIDSNATTVDFSRIAYPTDIAYADGYITFTNTNASLTDEYYVTVKATGYTDVGIKLGDLAEVEDTVGDTVYIKVNVADMIAGMAQLENANSLDINIASIANNSGNSAGYVRLSSFAGSTLTIDKLSTPTIEFDKDQKTLSWSPLAQTETKYNIYVNDVLVRAKYDKAPDANGKITITIGEIGLTDNDLIGSSVKIYIVAVNSTYFNSNKSNEIYVSKLPIIDTLSVTKANGLDIWKASFDLVDNVKEVKINSSTVSVAEGQHVVNFVPADFVGTTDFTIQLISKDIASGSNNNHYYLSSNESTFTLIPLSSKDTFAGRVTEENIEFDDLYTDFVGENKNPIRYTIIVDGVDVSHNQTGLTLPLSSIIVNTLTAGSHPVNIIASVNENYSITLTPGAQNNETVAVGYYGKTTTGTNIIKLQAITDTNLSIVDDDKTELILNNKLNACTVLSWQNVWGNDPATAGTAFVVTITYPTGQTRTFDVQYNTTADNYSCTLDSGYYYLTIKKDYLVLENQISIVVKQPSAIYSDGYSRTVYRCDNSEVDVNLTANGIMTISSTQAYKYTAQVLINGETIQINQLSNNESLNLLQNDYLGGKYGEYSIKILPYDANTPYIKMPSSSPIIVSGYKIKGLQSATIDDKGRLKLVPYQDDFSNVVWQIRTTRGTTTYTNEFTPVEENGTYYISLTEILNIFKNDFDLVQGSYTFSVTLRKSGAIDADWADVTFEYNVGESAVIARESVVKDYIKLTYFDQDKTTYFRVRVVHGDQTIEKYISAADSFGYWVVDAVNGTETFEKTIPGGSSYPQCYAILINDLLDEFNDDDEDIFGNFVIYISRVMKDIDETIHQYNQKEFSVYKLNATNGEEINTNYLKWRWNSKEQLSTNSPTGYYVEFNNTDTLVTTSHEVYTGILDLTTLVGDKKLVPNQKYNITVTAFSDQEGIIASRKSSSISTMRYGKLPGVEYKDGMLMFKEEELKNTDLINIITLYANENPHSFSLYAELTAETVSTLSPFNTTIPSLKYAAAKIKLVRVNSGALDPVPYYVTINLLSLMPDFVVTNDGIEPQETYIEVLNKVANNVDQPNFKDTIKFLVDSNHGLGDSKLLFDDFGREIPAGEYKLSILRCNEFKADRPYELGISNVESEETEPIDFYLNPAPQTELLYESDRYYVKMNPSTDIVTNDKLTDYKIIFRSVEDNRNISYKYCNEALKMVELSLKYVNGAWELKHGEDTIEDSEGVADEDKLLIDNGLSWVKLNLTALKYKLEVFEKNTEYQVDIFSFDPSVDSTMGKSATFTLNYLDLDINNCLSVQDGIIVVNTSMYENIKDQGYEILVRYEHEGMEPENKKIMIQDGIAVIDFDQAGLYNYIILSLSGSISANIVNVESESYIINAVYKLNVPEITVIDGNIRITGAVSDKAYLNGLSFNMGKVEDDLVNWYKEAIYYQEGGILPEQIFITVIPGDSEDSENTFYFYIKGSSVVFTIEETSSSLADHVLGYTGKVILSSVSDKENESIAKLKSKMLSEVNGAVQNGQYEWSANQDVLTSENETKVIYEVVVEYYSSSESLTPQETVTIYTTNTFLMTENLSENYSDYKIKVTCIAATLADEMTAGAIQTLEGEYYLLSCTNNGIYFDDGDSSHYALRSKTHESEIVSRTSSPYLSNDSYGITSGVVQFRIDDNILPVNIDIAEIGDYFKVYCEQGTTKKEIFGSFDLEHGIDGNNNSYVTVKFVPYNGEFDNINLASQITLRIYVSKDNNLYSKPLVIENIYKLPNVSETYYTYGFENENTVLDFNGYFSQINYSNNNSYYKIVVTTDGDNEDIVLATIESDSESKRFIIDGMHETLYIQVCDNQDTTASLYKLLLNSDKLTFKIDDTSNNGLNIEWDSYNNKFTWSWEENDGKVYQFYYKLTFSDGGSDEEGFTENYYYMPKQMGNINRFEIGARQVSEILTNNVVNVHKFSRLVEFNIPVSSSLFDSGNGTQASPYVIKNTAQFLNIAKRNQEGSKFYFKLADDISIDLSSLSRLDQNSQTVNMFGVFYGELNGNGKTLTINMNTTFDLDGYTQTLPGTQNSVQFNKYAALFREISNEAKVANININYSISAALSETNILYSTIALYNYGEIRNVTLKELTISSLTGNGDANNVVLSGIASINYGVISGCKDEIELNYSMPQRLALNFAYCSISAFNLSSTSYAGRITNCFNSGDKTVKIVSDNNWVYISGVSIINNSTILGCGNDGNFTINATDSLSSYTCYLAGIAISSARGTLEHVYNNGTLLKQKTFGSLYSGGIACMVDGGTIKNLVDTTSSPLIYSCAARPTHLGNNYSNSTTTAANITITALSTKQLAFTIDTANYYLIITATGDGYLARIS